MRVIGQDYNPSVPIYLLLFAVLGVLCAIVAWWLAAIAVAALLAAGKHLILLIQQGWLCACDAYNAYEYKKYVRRVERVRAAR